MTCLRTFLLLAALGACAHGQKSILVITADQSDYLLSAGGTVAGMIAQGATARLVRVTNDEKDSWDLPPEETARRARQESEEAARILGIQEVVSLGYRAGELGGVSPTELRDRLMFYIRLHKPDVVFLPNSYTHYDEVLDRFYTGQAAEEACRAAALENFQPAFAAAGLKPHVTPERYYYAQPVDPRRREPEGPATFVPQPKALDITAAIEKKVRAAQALKTANRSMALRIKQRLEESGRRLPLLDTVDDGAIDKLVEINVRKLGEIGAEGQSFRYGEEFQHAGLEYRIPSKYRK
ncbi:MAG: PIG-L family deacetylase [Bryobacteraceae bacterium]|nr:PIG-L family deacetylase [Bryobacteraceae bacterium]